MTNRVYASKATVGSTTMAPILDNTFADMPAPLSGKEDWLYNEYNADTQISGGDVRQQMALAVAWKNRATSSIRMDYTLRALHMGDIIQACMVAAYEPYSLKDCERVWYKRIQVEQADGTHIWVNEIRPEVLAMTDAEREIKYAYMHISTACRKAVKMALDLHGKEVVCGQAVELDTITAHRVHDAYLKDVDGSEWDRLDAMLKHCESRLYPTQVAMLRRLVAGEVTLSQLPSRSRDAIRIAVSEILHLDPTIVG